MCVCCFFFGGLLLIKCYEIRLVVHFNRFKINLLKRDWNFHDIYVEDENITGLCARPVSLSLTSISIYSVPSYFILLFFLLSRSLARSVALLSHFGPGPFTFILCLSRHKLYLCVYACQSRDTPNQKKEQTNKSGDIWGIFSLGMVPITVLYWH